jgi:hypothetical protein
MSPSKHVNRSQVLTAGQKLIVGLKKHDGTLTSLVIDGKPYQTADVIAVVQARVDAAQAVVDSRATWQANVLADKAERAKARTFMSGLVQALRVAFGNSVDVLADFGLAPHKPRAVRTPEEKAKATAKAKATRIARHTMGPKQKLAVKGAVPQAAPATPATATAPTAPAGASAPAPAAAPAPTAPHPLS